MMVTFVSMCEKKALPKTRRVLDAFANRIGDNTWQTIITEDGLIAIKKLLRKTATRSTAVSCHWIRSRSRSELMWVVGNKTTFNHNGSVPVNTTSKDLFIEISNEKPNPNTLYANTKLQFLTEHLFAVGYLSELICKKLFPDQKNLQNASFIAGCLHDLGKIDPFFQDWVRNPKKKDFIPEDGQHIDDTKFSFDKHPRHNEISTLLFRLLENVNYKDINSENKRSIKHAIFWHHAKPFRKENDLVKYNDVLKKFKNNLKELPFLEILKKAISFFDKLIQLDSTYRITDSSILNHLFVSELNENIYNNLEDNFLPSYKNYDSEDNLTEYSKQISFNSSNNILRSTIITADRLISSLSSQELHLHIKHKTLQELIEDLFTLDSTLISNIENCLSKFPSSERTLKQNEISALLSNCEDIAVLAGPAGCGKTKIALEWAKLKNAKQIIWVCPRVQVCQGLFSELTSDQYLPESNIEINTGEFKYINKWNNPTPDDQYFSGDIVITTIDQIFGSIISHTNANSLINFLHAHIVFDEFHEYINMPAFNLLFAELVTCKKYQGRSSNTLLVSATPHYYYLKTILNIDSADVISMPTFNTSSYKIQFEIFDESKIDDSNPLYKRPQPNNSFIISNTALTAQKSFILNQKNENSILLHSKFKKRDKQKWFEEVYESFKKDGTHKFNILRSGPIIQSSLNISCDHMVSELTNAEDCLQRLGRLDRFGVNEKINIYQIAVPQVFENNKGSSSSTRFLSQLFALASTKAWYNFIKSELSDSEFKLTKLYELYKKFYQSDLGIYAIQSDMNSSLKQSVILINKKVIDPITLIKKKDQKIGRAKINKNSLRGDNRFIQLAVCAINDIENPKFKEEYAYQNPINDSEDFDNLTASLNEIRGYGDSDKDLLAYMKNKHHNIKGGIKVHKDFILENEARDPEFPIYLSYTPNDLLSVGGESARHTYAIYYAICDKQPIGTISIKRLTTKEE